MKQYNQIKSKYPDALLLFRVGDFYETFGEDAVKAAHTLDIVLTNRNNGTQRLCELATAWVVQNPQPIALGKVNYNY